MGAYRITKDTNNFPSFMKVMMVFAHELTHTQDLSYMRWIEYRVFHYGKDGSHFFEEAVPSLASAYKEGLANFVGWWFARPYLSHVAAWHGTDGYVLVEKAPADATSADPSDLFIYNLLDPAKKQPVVFGDKNINDNYGVWKISGMPPRLLVHNEQIIALVLFYRAMATSTGFAEVMDSFKKSNAGNFRVSSSAWARLIDQLSTQLLPSTITRNNVANVSPGRALLLMALCDYFTGFRAKDQAELMAMFENQAFVKDWVVAYDTSAKASVRDAVRKWETANAAPPGNQSDRWRERLTGVTGVIAATVGIR